VDRSGESGGNRNQRVKTMNARVLALFVGGVAVIICGCGANTITETTQVPESAHQKSVGDQKDEADPLYTIADYDPGAHPSENLIATVSQASESGKRIILEIGGQW
jgi:hypothetical protein